MEISEEQANYLAMGWDIGYFKVLHIGEEVSVASDTTMWIVTIQNELDMNVYTQTNFRNDDNFDDPMCPSDCIYTYQTQLILAAA